MRSWGEGGEESSVDAAAQPLSGGPPPDSISPLENVWSQMSSSVDADWTRPSDLRESDWSKLSESQDAYWSRFDDSRGGDWTRHSNDRESEQTRETSFQEADWLEAGEPRDAFDIGRGSESPEQRAAPCADSGLVFATAVLTDAPASRQHRVRSAAPALSTASPQHMAGQEQSSLDDLALPGVHTESGWAAERGSSSTSPTDSDLGKKVKVGLMSRRVSSSVDPTAASGFTVGKVEQQELSSTWSSSATVGVGSVVGQESSFVDLDSYGLSRSSAKVKVGSIGRQESSSVDFDLDNEPSSRSRTKVKVGSIGRQESSSVDQCVEAPPPPVPSVEVTGEGGRDAGEGGRGAAGRPGRTPRAASPWRQASRADRVWTAQYSWAWAFDEGEVIYELILFVIREL